MSRSRRWWLIAGAVVVVLVLLGLVCRGPRGVEVEAVRVTRGPVEDAVTNSQAGTVRSRQRSRLGVELPGRIAAIPRREGSTVHRGELLLQLDEVTARGQLDLARRQQDAARAAVESARATATLAERDFQRARELFEQRLASQQQMDEARSRHESAAAGLEAARAQLEQAGASVHLAEDALQHLSVLSPFDGVVTQRFVEVGESIVPGQPVLEVLNPDSLYVSAPIDEMDIGRLLRGLPARITLDPYPGVVWHGTVSRVAQFVNDVQQQNRTLEIEVALAREAGLPVPKPGASADVEIIIRSRADALRVPTAALLEGHRVLVAERGHAVSREVTTGLRNWDWTEVRSGLKEGESVITTLDRQGLKAGAAIRAKERPGASGAPETARRP